MAATKKGPSGGATGLSLGPGFKVGHWTDPEVPTGCTVVMLPPGNISSCDIRGSSPGSRELAPLDVRRRNTEVHAILLTGGSAFGLAAADGVMRWLEEHGIGLAIGSIVVPIVPTAVIFDDAALMPGRRPGAEAGYAACEAAAEGPVPIGRVGAGAGATVGKWAGRESRARGGLGVAVVREDGFEVAALAVTNAFGDILADDGSVLAGTSAPSPRYLPPGAFPAIGSGSGEVPGNTVLAVVATAASLDKREVAFLAARGSDGITASVRPAHSRFDGDVVFAVAAPPAPGSSPADVDILGFLATRAVAAAVRASVS